MKSHQYFGLTIKVSKLEFPIRFMKLVTALIQQSNSNFLDFSIFSILIFVRRKITHFCHNEHCQSSTCRSLAHTILCPIFLFLLRFANGVIQTLSSTISALRSVHTFHEFQVYFHRKNKLCFMC